MFIFDVKTVPEKKPTQERSRERSERILCALEILLEDRLYEDVRMVDIAAKAGVPVGTLYQRFASKESLLPALFARHHEQVAERMASICSKIARKSQLKHRVSAIVKFAVDYHLDHKGLLRALTVYTRNNPQKIQQDVKRERQLQYEAIARLMIGSENAQPNSRVLKRAVQVLGIVNSVCREQLLFDDASPMTLFGFTVNNLRLILVDMAIGLLSTPDSEEA